MVVDAIGVMQLISSSRDPWSVFGCSRLCILNEEKLAQRMQILREREFGESARANTKK